MSGRTTAQNAPFTPSAVQLKQAIALFEHIAAGASEIDTLCFYGEQPGADDVEKLLLQINVMRRLVARLGWMADLGGAKLTGNGPEVKGGAEDWLLAPSYGWIEEPATGEVPHG